MKIIIVGYDSLEYDLVERFDLKALKQKQYCRIEINTGILSTPTVWTSFITGLSPAEHGVLGFKWQNRALNALKRWAVKIGVNRFVVDRSTLLLKTVAKAQDYWNINLSFPDIKGKVPTIFDYAEKPVDISVPCYSENMATYEELRHDLALSIGRPIAEKRLLKRSLNVFDKKRKLCLKRLGGSWDLFMVHFLMPDIVSHLRWYREDRMKELYQELDETTRLLKHEVDHETLLLIVSDHGQKKGLHTPYGFCSSSQKLNLHKPKITDFADIIREKLGVPPRKDIELVKKRLHDLGYI